MLGEQGEPPEGCEINRGASYTYIVPVSPRSKQGSRVPKRDVFLRRVESRSELSKWRPWALGNN
jgi:hypothetical protein